MFHRVHTYRLSPMANRDRDMRARNRSVTLPPPNAPGYYQVRDIADARRVAQPLQRRIAVPAPLDQRPAYQVYMYQAQPVNGNVERGIVGLLNDTVLSELVDDVLNQARLRPNDFIQFRVHVKVNLSEDHVGEDGGLLRRIPANSPVERMIFLRASNTPFLRIISAGVGIRRQELKDALITAVKNLLERYENGLFITNAKVEARFMYRPPGVNPLPARSINPSTLRNLQRIRVGCFRTSVLRLNNEMFSMLKKSRTILIDMHEDNECLVRALFLIMVNHVFMTKKSLRVTNQCLVPESVIESWDQMFQPHLPLKCGNNIYGSFLEYCSSIKKQIQPTARHLGGWIHALRQCLFLLPGPVSLEELPRIATTLHSTIRVRGVSSHFDTIHEYVAEGTEDLEEEDREYMTLLLDGNHIHAVVKETGLLKTKFYCRCCDKGYQKRDGHRRCKKMCTRCGTKECNNAIIVHDNDPEICWKQCSTCNRKFRTIMCYEAQKTRAWKLGMFGGFSPGF